MLKIIPLLPDPWLSDTDLRKIDYVHSEAKLRGLDKPENFMVHILVPETDALAISQGWKAPPNYKDVLLSHLNLKAIILKKGPFSESVAESFNQDLVEYSKL